MSVTRPPTLATSPISLLSCPAEGSRGIDRLVLRFPAVTADPESSRPTDRFMLSPLAARAHPYNHREAGSRNTRAHETGNDGLRHRGPRKTPRRSSGAPSNLEDTRLTTETQPRSQTFDRLEARAGSSAKPPGYEPQRQLGTWRRRTRRRALRPHLHRAGQDQLVEPPTALEVPDISGGRHKSQYDLAVGVKPASLNGLGHALEFSNQPGLGIAAKTTCVSVTLALSHRVSQPGVPPPPDPPPCLDASTPSPRGRGSWLRTASPLRRC